VSGDQHLRSTGKKGGTVRRWLGAGGALPQALGDGDATRKSAAWAATTTPC